MVLEKLYDVIEFIHLKTFAYEEEFNFISFEEIMDAFQNLKEEELETMLSLLEKGIITTVFDKNGNKKGWNIGWSLNYLDLIKNQIKLKFIQYNQNQLKNLVS